MSKDSSYYDYQLFPAFFEFIFYFTLIRSYFLFCFLQSCGLVPNAHVYSALISQAFKRLDYAYLHELLRHMHKLQVPPNDVIIRQLEFAAQYPPSYDKVRN